MAVCTRKSLQQLDQANVYTLRERDSPASGGDVSLLFRCEAPLAFFQVTGRLVYLRIFGCEGCGVKSGGCHNLSRSVTTCHTSSQIVTRVSPRLLRF